MDITVKNDGKERHDSFEVTAEVDYTSVDSEVRGGLGYYTVSIVVQGHGAAEGEARENFGRLLEDLRRTLAERLAAG